MGKVKLNIIGFNSPYDLEKEFDKITLKDIYIILIKKNLLLTDLVKCKFICNGNIMVYDKHIFDVNDKINIYIIIKNEDFEENDFKNIFIKKLFNVNLDDELPDSLDDIEETDNINNELCDYFKDPDFINLLNIIKTKPKYLEIVDAYLSHGDIIEKINFDDIDIEQFNYEKELKILNDNVKQNIKNWDEENVKKLLIKYDGNINLVSRYILV